MPKGQMIVNNPLHAFSIWCIHSFAVSFFTNIVKIRVLEHHGLVLRCLYAIDKHVCSSYFHHIHGIPFLVIAKVLYLVTTFVPIYQPLTPPLCGLCWSKNVCRFVYKSLWICWVLFIFTMLPSTQTARMMSFPFLLASVVWWCSSLSCGGATPVTVLRVLSCCSFRSLFQIISYQRQTCPPGGAPCVQYL